MATHWIIIQPTAQHHQIMTLNVQYLVQLPRDVIATKLGVDRRRPRTAILYSDNGMPLKEQNQRKLITNNKNYDKNYQLIHAYCAHSMVKK